MKLYKSSTNEIFAYEEDGSQDHLISSDFIVISNEEANAIREAQTQAWFATQPTKEEQIVQLQAQLDALKD